MINELKTSKELMEWGSKNESGSESKPEEGEIKNEDMDRIKPKTRPLSTKTEDPANTRSVKTSRKGPREGRELSFNKPTRNIKFL